MVPDLPGHNIKLKSSTINGALKPVFHLANLFVQKVGTVPNCSRQIFSPTNVNQSRCRILVFASRRANNIRSQVENRLYMYSGIAEFNNK